jgi:hypothetical protein
MQRNCLHKRAELLPLKADGPGATFRPVTDPALIALAVSPSRVRRAPTYSKKRRRVIEGREKARRKTDGEDETEVKGGSESEVEGVKKEDEIYGTITIKHAAEESPPEDAQMKHPDSKEESKEISYIALTANQNEGGEVLNVAPTTTDHRANKEESAADTRELLNERIVEGRVTDRKVMAEEEGNYADSIGEEMIQRAITKAIEASNHYHHSLSDAGEIGGIIEDFKYPEEPAEDEGGEISRQSSHQDLVILDDNEIDFYQPSIHTKSLHDDDVESELGQEPESDLHHPEPATSRLLESQSPALSVEFTRLRPPPQSQRPPLPLTPASTNPTPPPPPPSVHHLGSRAPIEISSTPLKPIAGPARWKHPCAKKSRFSGPKIYTPLTLHPPSGGLGIVDHTRTPPRRDGGDIRWERAKRQVSSNPYMKCR